MIVRVDRSECESNGICIGMAPDLFDWDGDFPVQVPSVIPPERRQELDQIVASCPKAALSLEIQDGG